MPRVRIEITDTLKNIDKKALMNDIMDAVVDGLKIVADDRNVSLVSYEDGLFCMKPPYCVFIEILMFCGRSKAVKKELFQSIVNRVSEHHSIGKECIMIVLNEQPRENWGLRGGIPGDEINFNYVIER
jgi:phenylpyruvate tautomerase PptA (4-oxalocrotonate tautomerase family)